jgi:hypothetical protein
VIFSARKNKSLLATICVLFSLHCGKDDGPFTVDKPAVISLVPSGDIIFYTGSVSVGESVCQSITIRNIGVGDLLNIKEVSLDYDEPGDGAPAFFINDAPSDGSKLVPWAGGGEEGEEATIRLCYRRYDDGLSRSASLVIKSNDPASPKHTTPVIEQEGQASLSLIPNEVLFKKVAVGTFADENVLLLNVGTYPVELTAFEVSGDKDFLVLTETGSTTVELTPGNPKPLSPPISLNSGNSHSFTVRFTPTGALPRDGSLIIDWTSSEGAGQLVVPLRGNQGPCIQVEPELVNFYWKEVDKDFGLPVSLVSCGQDPVEIRGIRLSPDGDPQFSLDEDSFEILGSSGGFANSSWPSIFSSKSILPNKSGRFTINYSPNQESPKDEDGDPIPDVTTIYVETNTFEGEVAVPVEGIGTLIPCTTAVISLKLGAPEVAPQTLLKLSAENSIPSDGEIESYSWSVVQPEGSASEFFDKDGSGNAISLGGTADLMAVYFEANVAGTYIFELDVTDTGGLNACIPAQRVITAIPDEAIHVELTWDTPGDDDVNVLPGADMDLHFVHLTNAVDSGNGLDLWPLGGGDGVNEGYFDLGDAEEATPWDLWWWYRRDSGDGSLDWGDPIKSNDNPTLDLDDTDGVGPENMNLNDPEDGVTYKVGVHYWNDYQLGPSTPTVRFYIYGVLVETVEGCPMNPCGMWEVGTIQWPEQTVSPWTCADGPDETACDNGAGGGSCDQVILTPYAPPGLQGDWDAICSE